MPSADLGRRAVIVDGPAGRVDLLCPASSLVVEVARAYAERTGLPTVPLLHDRTGAALPATTALAGLGIEHGELLVATTGIVRHAPRRVQARRTTTG